MKRCLVILSLMAVGCVGHERVCRLRYHKGGTLQVTNGQKIWSQPVKADYYVCADGRVEVRP